MQLPHLESLVSAPAKHEQVRKGKTNWLYRVLNNNEQGPNYKITLILTSGKGGDSARLDFSIICEENGILNWKRGDRGRVILWEENGSRRHIEIERACEHACHLSVSPVPSKQGY